MGRRTYPGERPFLPPSHEAGLDAALIHSTIDAIPSPNSLLARMGGARGIVREGGGLVVVVSAYEWNEEVTPRGAWLGGYLDQAGNQVCHRRADVHGVVNTMNMYTHQTLTLVSKQWHEAVDVAPSPVRCRFHVEEGVVEVACCIAKPAVRPYDVQTTTTGEVLSRNLQ